MTDARDPRTLTTPAGDVFTYDGDTLTIDAQGAIEGLVWSPHRRPVLVVDGARYTLQQVTPNGRRVRYALTREVESLYEMPGLPVLYDPERHVAARKQAVGTAAGWLAYAVLTPVMPLIGLLPQSLKHRLVAIGIDPTVSTGVSLGVEWFLCWPTVGLFFLTILASAPWYVVLTAALVPLTLVADLAYRWSGLQEDPPEHRGMLSVLPALVRGVRALKDEKRLDD